MAGENDTQQEDNDTYTQEIPTQDCDRKRREIERGGLFKVLSCTPIPERPGWSRISFQER